MLQLGYDGTGCSTLCLLVAVGWCYVAVDHLIYWMLQFLLVGAGEWIIPGWTIDNLWMTITCSFYIGEDDPGQLEIWIFLYRSVNNSEKTLAYTCWQGIHPGWFVFRAKDNSWMTAYYIFLDVTSSYDCFWNFTQMALDNCWMAADCFLSHRTVGN